MCSANGKPLAGAYQNYCPPAFQFFVLPFSLPLALNCELTADVEVKCWKDTLKFKKYKATKTKWQIERTLSSCERVNSDQIVGHAFTSS